MLMNLCPYVTEICEESDPTRPDPTREETLCTITDSLQRRSVENTVILTNSDKASSRREEKM